MTATGTRRLRIQIWLPDLRVGGTEVSLLAELRNLDRDRFDPTVVVLGADLTLKSDFEAAGITVHAINSGSRISRVRRIVAELRSPRPDVVNTMLFWPNIVVRPLARLCGIAVLTTLVNADYGPDQRTHSRHGAWAVILAQVADACTARFSTAFRSVSDEVAETMSRRLHLSRSKILTLHRGRDLSVLGRRTPERRAATRESLNLGDRTVFLSLGRQDHQKAQALAVRAFLGMKNTSNCVLLLVGRRGDASDEIAREVSRAGGDERVRLLGERSDVGDLLAAADFLLSTSLWEGLPGAVIEAMCLETPLVLSDIASSREASGGNAWFFKSGDEGACRLLLEQCLTSPYPQDLTQRCRERAVEYFDIENISRSLGDMFQRLASAK